MSDFAGSGYYLAVRHLSETDLLREFAAHQSEPAFAELMRRHMDLVYSAALRLVRDPHLAQDVTQAVFIALSRNSAQLVDRPVLAGWLHRTTRNIAAQTIRTEVRRRAREEEAAAMKEIVSTEAGSSWEDLAPHLDEAVDELSEPDRDALILRYFEKKSAAEIAQRLGTSDEAAQKRVQRAVVRLRELLARRGVTLGPGALTALIGANAVQAAPASIAAIISANVSAAGLSCTAAAATVQTIAMTTFQKTLVTAALAGAIFTGAYQSVEASKLKAKVQALETRHAPLAARLADLERENKHLSNQLRAAASPAVDQERMSELMKLRNQATLARATSQEVARLRSALEERPEKVPEFMTNAIASGLASSENWKKMESAERLQRMKETLDLADHQVFAIGAIMTNEIQRHSQLVMDLLTGKLTYAQAQEQETPGGNEQKQIESLLTADQLARFPEFQQAEKVLAAENQATSEARQLATRFKLDPKEQEQLRNVFYELRSSEPVPPPGTEGHTMAEDLFTGLERKLQREKAELERKLEILAPFVSDEQLAAYREDQLNRMQMRASAMQMLAPKSAEAAQ